MEADAPSDLEMELRRNLTPCKCGHVWLDHDHDRSDIRQAGCMTCECPEFRERF